MSSSSRLLRLALVFSAFLVCRVSVHAAMTNVDVSNFAFTPATVLVKPGDSVKWSWSSGTHSTTSSTGLWDSGSLSTPAAFTNVFLNLGSYPYFCSVHGADTMSGVVIVTNQPPIAIANPPNNTVYASPASFTLSAVQLSSDVTLTQVELFRGTTSLGVFASPPYSVNAGPLGVGGYTFSAVSTDNTAVKFTNSVAISVVTAVPILITNAHWLGASQFRFSWTANQGLKYVIQRSTSLNNLLAIATNTASSSTPTFTDTAAVNPQSFYRVGLLPNQ